MKNRDARLFWIISAISFLLALNFTPLPSRFPSGYGNLSSTDKDFLLKEYDAGIKEIEMRIEEEHDLFLRKIIFVGAVLGAVFFSASNRQNDRFALTPPAVFCVWVSVAVAAVMDARLMFNKIIIQDRGQWISELEASLVRSGAKPPQGWEHYVAGNSVLWKFPQYAFSFADRQLLTSLLFVLALFLSFRVSAENGMNGNPSGDSGIYRVSAIACLLLIAWPEMYCEFPMHIVLVLLGVVAILLCKFQTRVDLSL